jgi:tetratricopeptide (TPR) repeat protein
MFGGIALIVVSLMDLGATSQLVLTAGGGVLIFLGASLWMITTLALKVEATTYRQLDAVRDANELLARNLERLEAIAENTRISDAAKSLARRQEETDEIRHAFREDVRNQRWDAAYGLIREIEQRFGNVGEAQRLREELEGARREVIEARLGEAVEMIGRHLTERAWDRAQHEIERLRNVLRDDPRVAALQDRLLQHQAQHKEELLREWNEAVQRSDTDHAIEVLRQLDQYLTPGDAPALQETARSVFKEKLLQLGVQFRFAVKERRWHDALEVGLELIRDFPNTRMAQEVRDSVDVLRDRARTTSTRPPEAARSS